MENKITNKLLRINGIEKQLIEEKIFLQKTFERNYEIISKNKDFIKYHSESLNPDNFPADIYKIYGLE